MCKPFLIRAWSDRTLAYECESIEVFRRDYEPRGFYVVNGEFAYQPPASPFTDSEQVAEHAGTTEQLPTQSNAKNVRIKSS